MKDKSIDTLKRVPLVVVVYNDELQADTNGSSTRQEYRLRHILWTFSNAKGGLRWDDWKRKYLDPDELLSVVNACGVPLNCDHHMPRHEGYGKSMRRSWFHRYLLQQGCSYAK